MAEEHDCAVCFEVKTDPVLLVCRHSFCKRCIESLQGLGSTYGWANKCPICRAPLHVCGSANAAIDMTVDDEGIIEFIELRDHNEVIDVDEDGSSEGTGIFFRLDPDTNEIVAYVVSYLPNLN